MDIHFILVTPGTPENIGFVSRCLKNMGFTSLRLVNPVENFFEDGAKYTAYQAHDILLEAPIYSSLQEATSDIDMLIATTAQDRVTRHEIIPSSEISSFIEHKSGTVKSIGIVFGSEKSGLSKDDLKCCDVLTTIPMKAKYPSINLSHSVMIYAYELSQLSLEKVTQKDSDDDDESIFSALKEQLSTLISATSIENKPVLKQRILDRAALMNETDSKLTLQFLKSIEHIKKSD